MPYSRKQNVTVLSRYGGWLPASALIHESFINSKINRMEVSWGASKEHKPAVQKFKQAIEADPEMIELFKKIFLQVSERSKIKDFERLLYCFDDIVDQPPKFHIAEDENGKPIGEPIGVPMYLLFDLLSNTGAAYDLFRKPAFNVALQELLNSWGTYLKSSKSNSSLTDTGEGWFTPVALESLEKNRGKFEKTYVLPNPNAVNRGYQSWDAFFTREVLKEARPVGAPDKKHIIHSACESTVFRISERVKKHDQFWLKGQSYSLYDMLNGQDADPFVGGTVYQAFLSPQDYHRWHAPIDGTIKKAIVVPGTYYAVMPDAGAEQDDPDLHPGDPHGAMIRSQAWLTMSSARALIFIEAANPDIGLVCFIGVGMAEVSTCELLVRPGDKVKTGDQLGMFHFGGSSHALIFGPQVKLTFADVIEIDRHVKVNSIIAEVQKAPVNGSNGANGTNGSNGYH